jgi:HEAT repeat protein
MSPAATIGRLRSGRTPADRAAAALALAGVDSADATAALSAALTDGDPRVRSSAALALASLRDPASTAALARVVAGWTHPSLARCRRAALRTLVAFRSEQAAIELAHALAAAAPAEPLGLEERSALLAVVYAEPTGVAAPRVVRALVALLAHEDAATADRATVLLELFPAESYSALARTLRTARSPDARRRAATALRCCRQDEAVSALVSGLEDAIPEVRAAAARSLSEMRDPAAAVALHVAAEDADEQVREAARSALTSLGAVATATGLAARFAPLTHDVA